MKLKERKESILSLIKSKYIQGFFRKYWWRYILGIIFLIYIDYAQTKIPIIIGNVIDELELGTLIEKSLVDSVLFILGIAVSIIAGRVLWRYFIFGTARAIERDIRNDIFSQLEKLSLNFFHKHKTGEIMAYITNDLEAVRQSMGMGIMMICDVFCLLVFILTQMIVEVSIVLTIAAVVPLAVIAVVTLVLGPKLFRKFSAKQEAFAKVSDFVQEDISGIKVIKAFVQQPQEIESFKKINESYFSTNMNLMRTYAGMNPLMNFISGCAFAIAVGLGGVLTLDGTITVGDFTIFIQYLGMLVWPMRAVGMSINTVTMGSASLKRIESILNSVPEIQEADDAVDVDNFVGDIKVKDLTYAYPETSVDVLKNINFEIKRGQTLGIVGRTGSGKTTLMNLFERLYNPPEDTIFISGVDIMKLKLSTLRRNIGYVPQDNFLFSDNIRNNVDFVDGHLSDNKIIEATEFSCVHDNIVEFKDGYDTIVGEKGVTLSGGQKQRISISRAYINDPEILIMDDSVSAVDTDTEGKILHNLKTLRKGKTNIIIAHRLSAIQDADHILVFDDGKIVEQGKHKDLLRNNGLYKSLYEKQQLEKMIDEEH